jgi:hypothetical protein
MRRRCEEGEKKIKRRREEDEKTMGRARGRDMKTRRVAFEYKIRC